MASSVYSQVNSHGNGNLSYLKDNTTSFQDLLDSDYGRSEKSSFWEWWHNQNMWTSTSLLMSKSFGPIFCAKFKPCKSKTITAIESYPGIVNYKTTLWNDFLGSKQFISWPNLTRFVLGQKRVGSDENVFFSGGPSDDSVVTLSPKSW